MEDALYFLPNPFPKDQLVGVTKQTLAIVDDTNREVPLSEVRPCSHAPHAFSYSGLCTTSAHTGPGTLGTSTSYLPDN